MKLWSFDVRSGGPSQADPPREEASKLGRIISMEDARSMRAVKGYLAMPSWREKMSGGDASSRER